MLVLPVKRKWFDMILSGGKKEEYREIKPYYETRFMNLFGIVVCDGKYLKCSDIGLPECEKDEIQKIRFRNGYSKDSPSFVAKCTLSVGIGKEEWGAEKDKQYFILTIHEILKGSGTHEGTDTPEPVQRDRRA